MDDTLPKLFKKTKKASARAVAAAVPNSVRAADPNDRMCRSWRRSKLCPRREQHKACSFEHPPAHVAERKLCHSFRDTGYCVRGDKCNFQHTLTEVQGNEQQPLSLVSASAPIAAASVAPAVPAHTAAAASASASAAAQPAAPKARGRPASSKKKSAVAAAAQPAAAERMDLDDVDPNSLATGGLPKPAWIVKPGTARTSSTTSKVATRPTLSTKRGRDESESHSIPTSSLDSIPLSGSPWAALGSDEEEDRREGMAEEAEAMRHAATTAAAKPTPTPASSLSALTSPSKRSKADVSTSSAPQRTPSKASLSVARTVSSHSAATSKAALSLTHSSTPAGPSQGQ